MPSPTASSSKWVSLLLLAGLSFPADAKTIDEILNENEEMVKEMAKRARAAYNDPQRCNRLLNCKCVHNDCAMNNTGFECQTWPGSPTKDKNPICNTNAADWKPGQLLGYQYSSARLAPGIERSQSVIEDMCYTQELDTLWMENAKRKPGMWWQYYATNNGVMQMFPAKAQTADSNWCKNYDPRFRPWYVQASSGPKDVYLVLDRSNSMTQKVDDQQRLAVVRQAAKSVISTLTNIDYFGVIAFSGGAPFAPAIHWKPTLQRATDVMKESAIEWVNLNYDSDGGTNFTQGFEATFQMMDETKKQDGSSNCNQVVLFLTDGEDQILQGAKQQDATAAENGEPNDPPQYDQQRDALVDKITEMNNNRAIIFSYAFSEAALLEVPKMISCRNKGVAEQVTRASNLISTMEKYYQFLASAVPQEASNVAGIGRVRWSTPYNDATTGEEMTSPSVPVYDTSVTPSRLLGVVATDVLMSEFKQASDAHNYDQKLTELIYTRSNECIQLSADECILEALRGPPASNLRCGAMSKSRTTCGEQKAPAELCSTRPPAFDSMKAAYCELPPALTKTEAQLKCCGGVPASTGGSGVPPGQPTSSGIAPAQPTTATTGTAATNLPATMYLLLSIVAAALVF